MNYTDTVQYLYQQLPAYQRIGKAAYKADLDTTLKLDAYFNHPHRKFKSIHIAGTNGKGSTSHMLAAVLQAAGYKVGLYTSPHLYDFRERIRVNGEMICEDEVVDFVAQHRLIIEELKPSFFEMTAAMAFDYFARQSVDIAVIEVGMGGRLDSTNIISPLVSVITNIGLDHTEFLGDTVAKIAAEKAGIIKNKVPVVIGEWNAESAPVFIDVANAHNTPVIFADRVLHVDESMAANGVQRFEVSVIEQPNSFLFDKICVEVDLLGNYQTKNILTVLATVELLRKLTVLKIDQSSVINGLRHAAQQTGLQGRWQVLQHNPMIICDTGHNSHGLTYVMQQLQSIPHNKLYIVLGVVSDKDVDSILPLLPRTAYYFFTQANLPRAMDAEKLAKLCTDAGLQGEVVTGVANALTRAKSKANANDAIFVGGSTFVVAEVL